MATNTGISWPSAPDASGNLTLAGNLTVDGTTTLVGATTLSSTASIQSLTARTSTKTNTYTCDSGGAHDHTILADTSGQAWTLTLPANSAGRIVEIKKITTDQNALTISPASGNIDGASSTVLTQSGQGVHFVGDGTNWWTIAVVGAAGIANLNGGVFWEDDLLDSTASRTVAGNGSAENGIPTPGGTPTVPTDWTAAQINQHPGLGHAQVANASDAASLTMRGFDNSSNGVQALFGATGPAFVHTLYFGFPGVLSSSGDRYTLRVGMGFAANASATEANNYINGVYLLYNDNTNSGNWELCAAKDAGSADTIIQASNTPPVANTWYKLQFVKAASNTTVTAYLNGTSVASGNCFLIDPMPWCPAALNLFRKTSSANAVRTAFVDKVAFSMPVTARSL